jgi:hypothetical protein
MRIPRVVWYESCHSSIYYRKGGVRKLFGSFDYYKFALAGRCSGAVMAAYFSSIERFEPLYKRLAAGETPSLE